jgi:hypothetical protein
MGTTSRRQPATSPQGRIGAGSKPSQGVVPTRSWTERDAAGKALRETRPREAHTTLDRAIRKGRVKAVFEEER